MVQAEQPLTRRALHRAADAPPPAPPRQDPTRRSLRTSGHRHRAPSRGVRLPRVLDATKRLSFEAVVTATAVAFLSGAVTGVTLETTSRQQHAAIVQADARQARADRAATVRLTASAARYAQVRLDEALAAAHSALIEARAVLETAPDLIGRETVDPLGVAVAELTAMVHATDPTILAEVDPDATLALVADTDPSQDGPEPPAEAPAAADTVPAPPASAASTAPEASTAPVASTAPAASHAPAASTAPEASDADAQATSRTETEAAALAVAQVDGTVIDPAESQALMAAVEQVAALSTQVAALRDELAGELEAARKAAEARRAEEEAKRVAAEQADLARMAARIAATDAAPNGQIPLDLLCSPQFTHVLLRCDAAQALEQLNAAYRADFGRDLVVNGGYRTYAEQVQVREAKGDLAATPGRSNHGRGLAVDLSGFGAVGQFNDPDYLWMVENGPQFGWKHPPSMGPGGSGPLEPWHWEYGTF